MSQSDRELAREMGRRVAALEAQVKSLQSASNLTNASLEDTSIKVKDRDGETRAVMGRQSDGSHGAAVVEAGPQPVPSAPLVEPGTGTISVEWDGGLANQTVSVPRIFGRVEVWAALDDGSGDPTRGKRLGSITDREGGTTPIKATSGDWLVWLRMVGPDGKRVSDFSESASVRVEELVDGDAIQADIDQAKQDLADAESEWEQSKTDLQDGLDQINNETIPQVRTDAQQWADDAEAAAITQAAQDAQAEYDRLQEVAQTQIDALMERGGNLLVNGGFERVDADGAVIGWSGEFDHSRNGARSGDYAAILSANSADGGNKHLRSSWIPSQAGRTYRVTAWAWKTSHGETAGDSGFNSLIRAGLSDGSTNDTWGEARGWGFGVGGFQELVEDLTIPDDQPITEAHLILRAEAGSGSYRVDDVSLHDITEAAEALEAANQAEQAAQDAHAAAGDAQDRADTAMTRAGQVGARLGGETPPVGTAPENSLWFQWSDMDDPNRTVLGVWQMIDGNWTEQDSSEPALIPTVDIGAATVGTLKAVRIDVASLYADTAFVNNLHAETVEAMRVTSETGFIGGVLLEDGAVTTEKLTVTGDMTAAIAEFLEVKAVHMTANAVEAAHISVGALDGKIITAPLVQSHQGDRGWKLRPDGAAHFFSSDGSTRTEIDTNGVLRAQGAQIAGAITAESVDLRGALTVGNGEGSLTPEGNQLRLEGRMPATAGNRDMIVQGTTGSMTTNWERQEFEVLYESPVPVSSRRPIVSAHLAATSGGSVLGDGNVNVSSFARRASGFKISAQPMFSGGTQQYWVYYVAFWGVGV